LQYFFRIILAAVVSLLIYFIVFVGLLRKPLTSGFSNDSFAHKLRYSKQIANKRKVILIGGSNVLFSLRCEQIEQKMGIPCVNGGVPAELGLDLILMKSRDFVNENDIIIMPLEYHFYSLTKNEMVGLSSSGKFIAATDQRYLWNMGMEKSLSSLFSFNILDVFSSPIEMILNAGGFKGRYNVDVLNINGDMVGHTREKSKEYKDYLATLDQIMLPKNILRGSKYHSPEVIADFISYCGTKHALVYGALPTTFNDKKYDQAQLNGIRNFYLDNGARFISLQNNAQYDRDCFYDTPYHLNEECQIMHTSAIVKYLTIDLEKDTTLKKSDHPIGPR